MQCLCAGLAVLAFDFFETSNSHVQNEQFFSSNVSTPGVNNNSSHSNISNPGANGNSSLSQNITSEAPRYMSPVLFKAVILFNIVCNCVVLLYLIHYAHYGCNYEIFYFYVISTVLALNSFNIGCNYVQIARKKGKNLKITIKDQMLEEVEEF